MRLARAALLLRPGRVDRREHIGKLTRGDAWEMFLAYRPDGAEDEFDRLCDGDLPISAADMQGRLLSVPAAEIREVAA